MVGQQLPRMASDAIFRAVSVYIRTTVVNEEVQRMTGVDKARPWIVARHCSRREDRDNRSEGASRGHLCRCAAIAIAGRSSCKEMGEN